MTRWLLVLPMLLALLACAGQTSADRTSNDEMSADQTSGEDSRIDRGRYLVDLLSCAACHTDGQLVNDPVGERYLAGSRIGIAYTNHERPGVVFPSNLTPDAETGLGRWSRDEITRNIQYGIDRHGRQQLPIMPWPGYAHMALEDAQAITAYLLSLEPVKHRVPANVAPETRSPAPYVRYGVYLFYPDGGIEKRLDATRPIQPEF